MNITSNRSRSLGTFSLLMIAIVCVDSIRNLPIAAQYGTALITFYLIAGLTFFVPIMFVANRLATRYPDTGGSYLWIQAAFGERWGFISIWLQWIYNIIWYPTIFAFISATLASMIAPQLETNHFFILCTSIAFFWLLTLFNCLGIRAIGRASILYACLGTLIPMLLIIILAIHWISSGHASATPLTWQALIPNQNSLANLAFFINILFSLMGLDVIGMHAGDVKNPQRTYPHALGLACVIILFSLMLSSLAICVVVTPEKIGLINGLMDAFKLFFDQYHLSWGITFIGCAIILGSLGIATSWIISLARGLQVAASAPVSRLPAVLKKLNRHNMPYAVLILQGIVFTLLTSVFLLFKDINNSYWILSSMTAELALAYYIILFSAAFKLFRQRREANFLYGLLILAIITSFIGIIVGFIPPSNIVGAKAILRYEGLLCIVGMIALTPLLFILKKPSLTSRSVS